MRHLDSFTVGCSKSNYSSTLEVILDSFRFISVLFLLLLLFGCVCIVSWCNIVDENMRRNALVIVPSFSFVFVFMFMILLLFLFLYSRSSFIHQLVFAQIQHVSASVHTHAEFVMCSCSMEFNHFQCQSLISNA